MELYTAGRRWRVKQGEGVRRAKEGDAYQKEGRTGWDKLVLMNAVSLSLAEAVSLDPWLKTKLANTSQKLKCFQANIAAF